MDAARVLQIFVGTPKVYSYDSKNDGEERSYESGIFKDAVAGRVWVGKLNLSGDGQADLRFHGGPDRPVMMFGAELYDFYARELAMEIPAGGFGENLTMEGLSETNVCLGDIWETDSVRLEVSQARLPCFKQGRRLNRPDVVEKIVDARAGGWYCRTLVEGSLEAGEVFRLMSRPCPEWTIRRAFETFLTVRDKSILAELNAVPALSELWRERLTRISG